MGHPRRARGRWSGTGGSGALRCRPQPTRRTPEAHGRAWPSQGLGLARAQPLSKKNTAQKGNQFARGEERKKQSVRRKRGTTGAGRAAWRATQRFSQRPCAGGSVGGTDVPSRSVPCANVRQAAHLSRQLRSRPPPPAWYNVEVISAVLRPPQNFRDTSCTRTRRWDVHRQHAALGRASPTRSTCSSAPERRSRSPVAPARSSPCPPSSSAHCVGAWMAGCNCKPRRARTLDEQTPGRSAPHTFGLGFDLQV